MTFFRDAARLFFPRRCIFCCKVCSFTTRDDRGKNYSSFTGFAGVSSEFHGTDNFRFFNYLQGYILFNKDAANDGICFACCSKLHIFSDHRCSKLGFPLSKQEVLRCRSRGNHTIGCTSEGSLGDVGIDRLSSSGFSFGNFYDLPEDAKLSYAASWILHLLEFHSDYYNQSLSSGADSGRAVTPATKTVASSSRAKSGSSLVYPWRLLRACQFYYEDDIVRLIYQFKYHKVTSLANFIASWMSYDSPMLCYDAEIYVPVPSLLINNIKRGFKPTEVIARRLALLWNRQELIPWRYKASGYGGKLGWILPQTRKSKRQRTEMLLDNITIEPRVAQILEGKKILLIDDIFTTGATAISYSRALLNAGAKQVDVLVFAITPLSDNLGVSDLS